LIKSIKNFEVEQRENTRGQLKLVYVRIKRQSKAKKASAKLKGAGSKSS
jgi:hypothetical protein